MFCANKRHPDIAEHFDGTHNSQAFGDEALLMRHFSITDFKQ